VAQLKQDSSFHDFLVAAHPGLLPRVQGEPLPADAIPHGTTVLALKYRDGVMIAGDRMAVEGFNISDRRMEKVHRTDAHSAMAIAGAAGPCLEVVRLFQTELEHYEKMEGAELSPLGKANKLGQMVRANLPAALQGLVVIPIFVGYDVYEGMGKIFKYDVTGGTYEEAEFHATGAGGKDARNTLKKFYHPDLDMEAALEITLEALQDAADETLGTAGIDLERDIYPTVKLVTTEGIRDIEDQLVHDAYLSRVVPNRNQHRANERR